MTEAVDNPSFAFYPDRRAARRSGVLTGPVFGRGPRRCSAPTVLDVAVASAGMRAPLQKAADAET
jgi:hypothetical protein